MKKILALTSCVVLLSSSAAMAAAVTSGSVSAEAASIYGGTTATEAGSGTSTLIGKLSKGVKLGANYGTAGYALTTKHTSGNTDYGTAHDATAIFRKDNSGALAAPSQPGSSAFTTDWTAM